MAAIREFDLVLLGATGYTGKLCAEHIVEHHPADLKWALAGRSVEKLERLAQELKALNPDRLEPEIVPVQLNKAELDPLVQRTKVVVNCVGPYHIYSTPVVEACATHGTHYVDVTGETPWILENIAKYHETAKSSGAIMISSDGVESAPPDMLAWALVKCVREKLSVGVKDMTVSMHEMKAAGASGGTLSTILTVLGNYKLSDLAKTNNPWCLAFTPQTNKPAQKATLFQRLFGVRSVPDLGTLATSPAGMCDVTIIHRSSTMMPDFYGPRFQTSVFARVRNAFIGVAVHLGFALAATLLILSPVRWLVRKLIYAPGQGPTKEQTRSERIEYRAVAVADQDTASPKRAFGRLSYERGPYPLSGLLMAEAAMVILKSDRVANEVSGGFLTPAVLGQEYIDRLDKVGVSIETKILEH